MTRKTYSTLDVVVYLTLSYLLVFMVLTSTFDFSRAQPILDSLFLALIIGGAGWSLVFLTVYLGRFVRKTLRKLEARETLRRVAFRIRREYFDEIVDGTKTREVRKASSYWLDVAAGLRDTDVGPCGTAVFVCGADVHRREIVGVKLFRSAAEALGRDPSPQGLRDVGDGVVLGFDLGEVVE